MAPRHRRTISFATKLILVFTPLSFALVICGLQVFHSFAMRALMSELGDKLLGIACTTAADTDSEALLQLRSPEQETEPAGIRLRQRLIALRLANVPNRISDIYLMRRAGEQIVFISNAYLLEDTSTAFDQSATGEDNPRLGDPYSDASETLRQAFHTGLPTIEPKPYTDKWGTWLSGYAPVTDAQGKLVAMVGVDASVETVEGVRRRLVLAGTAATALSILLSATLGILVARGVARPIRALTAGVNAVKTGDFHAQVNIRSGDEIEGLGEAFNNMVRGLREREQLKGVLVRHLSYQVAQKVMEDPDAVDLGGERVQASIFFADLRNFTGLSHDMPAHRAVAILNQYFAVVVEVILAHDGTLDKFLGDGVMAVFGAPVPQPDHAQRAIRCALAVQEAVAELNRKRAETGELQLSLGIGISSGDAIAGQIGTAERLEYTVIGREVNRASRIQGVAGPGEVIISEESLQLVRDRAEVADAGRVELKGFPQPVQVYRVLALKEPSQPPQEQ
jgi:class 3 adenylate cyclase